MKIARGLLCGLIPMSAVCCNSPATPPPPPAPAAQNADPVHDDISILRADIDRQQFAQALVQLKRLENEAGTNGEDWFGFEYAQTINAAAVNGRGQLDQILGSPQIPLDYKIELVREIDAASRQ